MKTSPAGRALIEEFEGLFLEAYDDFNDHIVHPGEHIRGTLTIGYGHTSAAGLPHVYPGMKITKDQADQILASDLAAVEADVTHHVKPILTQHQFDALVSFDFNTGALSRSNVLRAINSGHPTLVPGDLMAWVHAGGRVLSGLVRRRRAEGKLWATPDLLDHGMLAGVSKS